jgi:hypothetical protein
MARHGHRPVHGNPVGGRCDQPERNAQTAGDQADLRLPGFSDIEDRVSEAVVAPAGKLPDIDLKRQGIC